MSRVFVPIPISGIEEEKEQPSLTYKLDLDTGRIVGKVYDFEFEFNEDSCNVHFTADTIYGTTEVEEVI